MKTITSIACASVGAVMILGAISIYALCVIAGAVVLPEKDDEI